MKTIKILSIAIFSLIVNMSFAQKKEKVDEKTRNYYQIPAATETTDYTVSYKNIVGKFEYIKFGMTINNKTSDFLIWDKAAPRIVIADGEKELVKQRVIKVKPYGTTKRTFEARGGGKFLVNEFDFKIAGISRVSIKGNVQKMDDFKLPQEKNTFTSGNFSVSLKKVKKKTDETYVYFDVVYNGDDVAVCTLNEISARVNDNDVFANDNRKTDSYLLVKGEKLKIKCLFHIPAKVADMQFADMYIQFNNCFSESKAIPVNGANASFELNEELTKKKN